MGNKTLYELQVSYDSFVTASGVYPVVSHFKMAEGQNKWELLIWNKCPGLHLGSLSLHFVLQMGSYKSAAIKLCPNGLLNEEGSKS